MACNKLFLVFLLGTISSTLGNNVTIGARESGDFLLQRNYIQIPDKTFQIVELTQTFSQVPIYRITQAKFIDMNRNGKGADVKIIDGGVEKNFVKAYFASQRGNEIEFQVEIYGQ